MAEGSGSRWAARERGAVEAVFEDRFNTLIRTGADGQGTVTGGFQPLRTIAFPQAHNAET